MSSLLLKGYPRFQILEVFTVGLPFCGFKLLSGFIFLGLGVELRVVGALLIALAAVDLLINAINGVTLFLRKERFMDACLLAVFARLCGRRSVHPLWAWQDFGNSLDVLLCFVLVAAVVGLGMMKLMAPHEVALWNLCVVLNVLGAGLGRFAGSLKRFFPGV